MLVNKDKIHLCINDLGMKRKGGVWVVSPEDFFYIISFLSLLFDIMTTKSKKFLKNVKSKICPAFVHASCPMAGLSQIYPNSFLKTWEKFS